ncbi:hypothetical protein SAMN05444170_1776 [Bradyrhizobium erythrophlei]|uniref:General secretion pathway protein N n=1 Tax=Bradyrhizobium erythrophlei TaxID=1437360 RepID=A0A1M7TIJ8_9BRAD|nr:hypothetical protein SAMN05444170_1776 [Bradyrhizobium erythrophlei]
MLLAGVALLGAFAGFDEMMAGTPPSVVDAAGEKARGTSQSLQQGDVATYQVATEKLTDATAQERSVGVLLSPLSEGREGRESPSQRLSSNAESPNPLWELPLERLSITRERPIFSPSRRPLPPPLTYVAPMAVRQSAKPPEPERLSVSLIGTVIGTDVQIGIFLEKATSKIVRLRLGEEHKGWVLRLVKAREATLVKDVEETLLLDPPPGEAPAVRVAAVSPPVPNSFGTIPIVNTADYVDEQPLPRGAQRH